MRGNAINVCHSQMESIVGALVVRCSLFNQRLSFPKGIYCHCTPGSLFVARILAVIMHRPSARVTNVW